MTKNKFVNTHQIIKTPQGDVCFDYEADIYTVMISGGIDSAVTLYALCNTIAEKHPNKSTVIIHPLHVVRSNSTNIGVYDFRDTSLEVNHIVEFVKSQFKELTITQPIIDKSDYWWIFQPSHTGELERKYVIAQEALIKFVEWKYRNLDNLKIHHYHGNSKSPNIKKFPKLKNVVNSVASSTVLARDKDSKETIYHGSVTRYVPSKEDKNIVYYQPFRNADKRIIMWVANKLNVLEKLNDITNSCEGDKYQTGNFKYTCNKCWWCLERQWALDNYVS